MFTKSVLAGVMAVAFLIPDLACAQVSTADRLAPGQPPVVAMSTKAMGTGSPEQSLAGFKWAIDRGVDLVVVGVQKTLDDRYIAMRDVTLPRTTNVREVFPDGAASRDPKEMAARMHIVGDYTLDEIRKLRLVGPGGGDERVPTLDDVLDLIGTRALAILKLDVYDADSLAALLEARDTTNLFVFTWSDRPKLRDFSAATGIGVWDNLIDTETAAELERFANLYGPALKVVDVRADEISPDLVTRATELGVRLSLVGGVEDVALAGGDTAPWEAVLGHPVAAYMTDHPDALLNLLGR